MNSLQVTIDPQSGFCFGVVYAIQMAEDFLDQEGALYCLGDIVHNDEEVARLNKKGLKIIDHEELRHLKNEKVLIRAHGEPPETYQLALSNNLTLLDASCPVVLKLQNRVRDAWEEDIPVVILGKHGHAEVNGLLGQTLGKAIVIEELEELEKYTFPDKVALFSQTTKSAKKLYKLKNALEEKGVEVQFNDTLCRQVSNRDAQLRKFAASCDVIVFVSGKKSSNGKVLYEVCKETNHQSYFISHAHEVDPEWFNGVNSVGICGATSTPQWLMEEVKKHIENL